MNRWNKVMFRMLLQIQKIKLIQQFLDGHGQKWPWSFSS